MLSLAGPDEDSDPQRLYAAIVVESEIVDVSRDLFASGHFSLAIQEAFKALEKFVQVKAGHNASGTVLMDRVFSPKNPLLGWSPRAAIGARRAFRISSDIFRRHAWNPKPMHS
jgi:hypothetical protein